MGPYTFHLPPVAIFAAEIAANRAAVEGLSESLGDDDWLAQYRAAYPLAIVTRPAYLFSGFLEVSLPSRAAQAFATVEEMRKAYGKGDLAC